MVLFRVLRHSLRETNLTERWSDYCLELAERTADTSLIETVLIVRPDRAKSKPGFLLVANDVAIRSNDVAKLLKKLSDMGSDRMGE